MLRHELLLLLHAPLLWPVPLLHAPHLR